MLILASVTASGGALVDLDATILIQFVIFIFVFLVFRQLLFKPAIRLIEARREATEGTRTKAEKMDNDAKELNEDVEKRLKEIRSSASSERDKLVDQARRSERDLMTRAREDAHGILAQSRKEMSEQALAAKKELEKEIGALADSVASKILGRRL
jgi:F-type H+-transporting ATPase subunit b